MLDFQMPKQITSKSIKKTIAKEKYNEKKVLALSENSKLSIVGASVNAINAKNNDDTHCKNTLQKSIQPLKIAKTTKRHH
ncbi:MAG: hypothetical protein R2738_10200 [Bacteroides graminisolvens]